MSHWTDVPLAEIRVVNSMLRIEFANGDVVQVPEHQGLLDLFEAYAEYQTRGWQQSKMKQYTDAAKRRFG